MSIVRSSTDHRRVAGRRAALTALAVSGALLTACGSDDRTPVTAGDAGVAAIGEVPGSVTARTSPTVPDLVATTTTSTAPPPPVVAPLGDDVEGDLVVLIGDDVLAATAVRNDGIGCDVLTGFGWDVEIAAEPGRFVDFASVVLDARLAADPAVIGIMLGHRFDGSLDGYRTALIQAIEAADGRPVMLYTIGGVFTADGGGDDAASSTTSINRVVESLARQYPNVIVVDWYAATVAEPDLLLLDGGPTPTAEGAGRIAVLTAGELGDAPGIVDGPGECLDSDFDSDEAIIL